MVVKCWFVFPLEVLLFLFAPTYVFLVRFFVKDSFNCLEGEGTSRVCIARGRRCSQARYPSVLEGLEAPRLLDRSRFIKQEREKLFGFFDAWGGVVPLVAPEGVLTMMGHSRRPLLTSRL